MWELGALFRFSIEELDKLYVSMHQLLILNGEYTNVTTKCVNNLADKYFFNWNDIYNNIHNKGSKTEERDYPSPHPGTLISWGGSRFPSSSDHAPGLSCYTSIHWLFRNYVETRRSSDLYAVPVPIYHLSVFLIL